MFKKNASKFDLSNKKLIFSWCLLIFWMIIIFKFSSQNAEISAGLSTGIASKILALGGKFFELINIPKESFEHFIRKAAHFTEYFILGVLALNTFSKTKYKKIYIPIIFCVLYATSDEIHQIFVPGRACLFTDILLDSFGSLTGVLSFYFLYIRNYLKK